MSYLHSAFGQYRKACQPAFQSKRNIQAAERSDEVVDDALYQVIKQSMSEQSSITILIFEVYDIYIHHIIVKSYHIVS